MKLAMSDVIGAGANRYFCQATQQKKQAKSASPEQFIVYYLQCLPLDHLLTRERLRMMLQPTVASDRHRIVGMSIWEFLSDGE